MYLKSSTRLSLFIMAQNIMVRNIMNAALKLLIAFFIVVTTTLSTTLVTNAKGLSLIRDAEIESLLKSYTLPIFKAANLNRKAVDVYIVNNNSFNAFVTGSSMFIHTGALTRSTTPNQIIGVIAHETGHIIGGHQVRMRDRVAKAQILGAIGVLLGAGAIATGGRGGEEAGAAIIAGTPTALKRSLLSYKRDEETAADRGAITLLKKSNQSGLGMLKTFERFQSKLSFNGSRPDPFIQSHPLPRARIALLKTLVNRDPNKNKKDSPALQLRHDMARAKIAAYTQGFKAVQRLFKNNLNGAPARYGLAIAQFKSGKTAKALKGIDRLIKEQPKNAYLHEMKAEILHRAGKSKLGIPSMKRAIKLDRYKSGLLRITYGQLLLGTKGNTYLKEAITQIKTGLAKDPSTVTGYQFLAMAYGRTGQTGLALAATAEQRFLLGRYKEAKKFALRAQAKVNKGSPQWLRLQDIVLYKRKKKK